MYLKIQDVAAYELFCSLLDADVPHIADGMLQKNLALLEVSPRVFHWSKTQHPNKRHKHLRMTGKNRKMHFWKSQNLLQR